MEKEEADSFRTRVLDLEAERAVLQEQIEAAKQATQAKLKAAKEDYDKEIAGLRSQLAKARASSSRATGMSAEEAGMHLQKNFRCPFSLLWSKVRLTNVPGHNCIEELQRQIEGLRQHVSQVCVAGEKLDATALLQPNTRCFFGFCLTANVPAAKFGRRH